MLFEAPNMAAAILQSLLCDYRRQRSMGTLQNMTTELHKDGVGVDSVLKPSGKVSGTCRWAGFPVEPLKQMVASVSRSGSTGPASSLESPRLFQMLVKGQSCHVGANKRSV